MLVEIRIKGGWEITNEVSDKGAAGAPKSNKLVLLDPNEVFVH